MTTAPFEPMPFHGFFYDGHTAARAEATITLQDRQLVLQTPHGARKIATNEVLPVDARRHGVQFVRLTDGSTCELQASDELLRQLGQSGVAIRKASMLAAVLHGKWRIAAMALLFLVGVISAFYVWVLPLLAEISADAVPPELQRRLGQAVIQQMDKSSMTPSKLPAAQQAAIEKRFQELTSRPLGPERKDPELFIRQSTIGPNAFALPGNYVVLTDEMVTLVDGDLDTISGVLAHELGHLEHQHGMRTLIQTTALTVLGATLIGDYSSVLATAATALGHLHYSRRFEAEADAYAYAMLCDKGIDPARTSVFFDKVTQIQGNVSALIPSYLSSHPASPERAAYFRKPCPGR